MAAPVGQDQDASIDFSLAAQDEMRPPADEPESTGQAGAILRDSPFAERLPSHKGVTFADDEYVIALVKPGFFFWFSLSLAFLFVITIPLAIWLLRGAGKQYWITTKRSLVLPLIGSKLRSLEHKDLAAIESSAVWLVGPQRTLRLKPYDRAGQEMLSFPYCTKHHLNALWGSLALWRLPNCDIYCAPAVDRQGRLLDSRANIDVVVLSEVELSQKEGLLRGPCLVDSNGLTIFAGTQKGAQNSAPQLPIYHLLLGLAQRAAGLAAFQLELRELLNSGILHKLWTGSWSHNAQDSLRDSGELTLAAARDSSRNSQASLRMPKDRVAELRSYLQQRGMLQDDGPVR
jgi:hypothetical protein